MYTYRLFSISESMIVIMSKHVFVNFLLCLRSFLYVLVSNIIYLNLLVITVLIHNNYEVFGSLVVTLAVIRLPGPKFKPRLGQKFGSRFLFHHSCMHTPKKPPQKPKMILVPVPSPDKKEGGVQIIAYHRARVLQFSNCYNVL